MNSHLLRVKNSLPQGGTADSFVVRKAKEIASFLQHQFSAPRRKKSIILTKEWLMKLPVHSCKSNALAPNLPPDPAANTWRHAESHTIDTGYYKLGLAKLVEDKIISDSEIHTEHEYIVHKLYSASSYTNETTHRTIFSRTGEPIEYLSSVRSGSSAPSKRRVPVSKNISGVTANLYGTVAIAEGNYFHWFVDALSRLFLIERFHSLDEIDHVLVPPLKHDFQWDSLAALGFDRSKVIEMNPLDCLEFECLLASSAPRGKGSSICPGWVIDRYNKEFTENTAPIKSVAGKRIFITRRDAPNRMFLNENEVCSFLKTKGFDIVELTPLNLWEKIAVFREAELIVSQTGAGLANLMFCKSDVKVLELVDEKLVYPLFAGLVSYRGGTHHPQFFSNQSVLGRTNAFVAKSSINIDELEKTLATINHT